MKPGIHEIPSTLYHADIGDTPTLSASVAHILLTASPAHARTAHPKLNPDYVRIEEQKFDVGTACHALMLEGIENVCVVPYDDWRTKASQEIRDQARADGMTPLLTRQWSEVQEMAAAVQSQLGAHEAEPPLFANGKPERTLIWEDSGVTCRARVDWLHDDYSACDDMKSTGRSANPEQWCKTTFWSIGADVQAAFYRRGVAALTGRTPEFRFVVCETTAPYAISVIAPGPDVLMLADKKIDYALSLWRRCLERDEWPGYTPEIAYAEVPPWIEAAWLEKELRAAAA